MVLNIPEQKVRVVSPDVGGGFGVKQFHYGEEAIITWAAKKVGTPIKWVSDRAESFISDRHGRDHVTEAELALDEHGKFLGFRVHTLANMGGYLSTFGPNIPTNLYAPLLGGVYTTPAIYCNVKVIFTNTVPVDAYRGAGRPEATFLLERIVDVAAVEMGIDRAEIRRRNMIPKSAYLRCWSSTIPAIPSPASTARRTSPMSQGSRRARRPPPPRASFAGSATRPMWRLAAWRPRASPLAWARAPGFLRARRCA
jgi:CO/xanthine dehydrogenase Mo-binding subunit